MLAPKIELNDLTLCNVLWPPRDFLGNKGTWSYNSREQRIFLDEFEETRLSLLLTGTLATHFREQLNLLMGSKNF